jgi:hypothetical protein
MTIAMIVFLTAAAVFVFYLHRSGEAADDARASHPPDKDAADKKPQP